MKYLFLITLLTANCITPKKDRKEFKYKNVSISIILKESSKISILDDELRKLDKIKSSIDNNENECNKKIFNASSKEIYNALIKKAEEIFKDY